MNLVLVPFSEVDETGQFRLSKEVVEHLSIVLKAETGDAIKVGVADGQKGLGQINLVKGAETCRLLPLYFQSVADIENYLRDHKPHTTEDDQFFIWPGISPFELSLWKQNPLSVPDSDHMGTPRDSGMDAPPTGDSEPFATRPALEDFIPFTSVPKHIPMPLVDLALALPRPRTFDKVLQFVTSMSVGRITIFAGARAELAYLSSPKVTGKQAEKSIRLGLEQSGKTIAPPVDVVGSWGAAFRQLQESVKAENHLVLIAHPYRVGEHQPRPLLNIPILQHYGPILIILGPERGFTDEEVVEMLEKLPNTYLVDLGTDILRVEVACCALLAQCQLLSQKSPLRREEFKRSVPASAFREPRYRISPRGPRRGNEKIIDAYNSEVPQ